MGFFKEGGCPVTFSKNWGENKYNKNLVFSVGLPRSGKSTFTESWGEAHSWHPRVIINVDDYRSVIAGQNYHRNSEPLVWGCVSTTTKALLKNYSVFFDDTNTSEWSLQRLFEIYPQAQYVMVHTAPDVCVARAYKTPSGN